MSISRKIVLPSVLWLPSTTAFAASPVPVGILTISAAGAVAMLGLIVLGTGLSRLSSGTAGPAFKFGFFGGLGRFGRPDRAAGETNVRRAVTSILVGVALLGLPDMFGVGIVSQARVAYQQSRPVTSGYVGGSEIVTKAPSRSYSSGGSGGEASGGAASFPWWMLALAGLVLLLLASARALSGSDVRTAAARSAPDARSASGPHVSVDGDGLVFDPDLHPLPESGSVGDADAPKSLIEILIETMHRIRERIRILLKSAKEQLRRLADETEEQKGRFRPLAAFAVQQFASMFRVLADKDDGGSGLPPEADIVDPKIQEDSDNATAYAEQIGLALSLQGSDLIQQLAKALDVPRNRVESDLHRLGATGAPGNWVRLVNVLAGREWVLAEHHNRVEERRFEGVIKFADVDWFATLSISDRPSNVGVIFTALPGRHVHLVSVKDDRATALAAEARARGRLPDGGSWTLADLPLERISRHFGDGSDRRWHVDPDGPPDEILIFDVQPKRIVVASGSDRLQRAISSEEDPVRALVHVRKGAAIASLGVSIGDIVPME